MGTGYYDPHTQDGITLDGHRVPVPILHDCGTIVIDEQWQHTDVCSPFWRAYLNFAPGAGVELNKLTIPLEPGEVLILPEGTCYSCVPGQNIRHLWIHFSLDCAWPGPAAGPWKVVLEPAMQAAWAAILTLCTERDDAHIRKLRYACTAALISAFGCIDDPLLTAVSPQIRSLSEWLEAHLMQPPTTPMMATHMGMSQRSFIRWFQKETRSTPAHFLMRLRIRHACRLLRYSSKSIEHIAEATGFANRNHFSRVFAQHTGSGPAAYRRRAAVQ